MRMFRFAGNFVLCFGQLVGEARTQERLLWYTSMHPDTPLHKSLPLNTAVALPISLSVLRRDLCFVFFAEHDVNVSLATVLKSAAPSFVVSKISKFPSRTNCTIPYNLRLTRPGPPALLGWCRVRMVFEIPCSLPLSE